MHCDPARPHDRDVIRARILALDALITRLLAIALDFTASASIAWPLAGLVAFRVWAQGALEL